MFSKKNDFVNGVNILSTWCEQIVLNLIYNGSRLEHFDIWTFWYLNICIVILTTCVTSLLYSYPNLTDISVKLRLV